MCVVWMKKGGWTASRGWSAEVGAGIGVQVVDVVVIVVVAQLVEVIADELKGRVVWGRRSFIKCRRWRRPWGLNEGGRTTRRHGRQLKHPERGYRGRVLYRRRDGEGLS